MEAVSAAAAIVGLTFNCATAVKGCNDLRGKYKNADHTLRSIGTEASTLRASLLQLHHLMLRDPESLSSRWDVESMLPQTFETAIESFTSVLAALIAELDKFNGKKAASQGIALTRSLKLKMLWNEATMQDVLVQLRAQQQSLQFLLTILQMSSISEIRNGIRKQKDLLRRIARSTKELECKRTEPLKRKTSSSSDRDNESGSNDNTNSDETDIGEPPAKRRSLSPESDVKLSPSPARTRSGKVYHPLIISTNRDVTPDKGFLTVERHQDDSAGTSELKSQSPHTSSHPQASSRGPVYGIKTSPRVKGAYGLGRSFSPVSSTWGSSFTFVASQQQTFGLRTPPETPNSEQQKMIIPDAKSKGRRHVRASRTRALDPLPSKSNNTKPMVAPDKVCLDSPGLPNSSEQPSQPSLPIKLRNYRSPDVESDLESDEVGGHESSGLMKSIERDKPSYFEHYQTRSQNETKSSAKHKDKTDATLDKATDTYTSEDMTDTLTEEETLPMDSIMSTNSEPVAIPRRSVSPKVDNTDYMVDGVVYRVPAHKTKYSVHSSYHSYEGSSYNADAQSSSHYASPRRRKQTPRQSANKKPQAPTPPTIKATEANARKHRIPPGYSLKNWDPSEEPIMLLGSVFDSNSLGKWIYDWTVYRHGPTTPITDMAGELWLLLIQLAGKVKRAEECMPRIRLEENHEMIEDFIESGERLTDKLKKLLKACEAPMLKAGKQAGKDTKSLSMNAGSEFVDSIFGPERQLVQTEKFMCSIRLWNLRFDANCEDILRQPGQ